MEKEIEKPNRLGYKITNNILQRGTFIIVAPDFTEYTIGNEPQDLLDILARDEAQAKLDNAYNSLQTLCDTKSKEAKNYINGSKVTQEQLARYEEKYRIAKEFILNGSYIAQLQLEADLVGITVQALANLIIQMGDAYKLAIITFNAKIEAFRVAVKKIIVTGDIARANTIIEKAKALDSNSTDTDIRALLA